METGLFELQSDQFGEGSQPRPVNPASPEIVRALFGPSDTDATARLVSNGTAAQARFAPTVATPLSDPATALARCFLQLADLPNFALDRLSRYEAALWRQVGQVLFALDALDRRKPQERMRRFGVASRHEVSEHDGD